MSAHLTTPEQEAELLAILRKVAPAKREDAWHLEECTAPEGAGGGWHIGHQNRRRRP